MNPYLIQIPIFVPLPALLQAQANYLALLQKPQQADVSEVNNSSSSSKSSDLHAFQELEKNGISAYSVITMPKEQFEKSFSETIKPQVTSNIRKAKKVSKPWHLPSHKLFRNAIYKQIVETLHDPNMAIVLNRLTSVGCDVKKYAFAIESKLYYNAERLEEYLEYTTLRKRICEEMKKTKKVYI